MAENPVVTTRFPARCAPPMRQTTETCSVGRQQDVGEDHFCDDGQGSYSPALSVLCSSDETTGQSLSVDAAENPVNSAEHFAILTT